MLRNAEENTAMINPSTCIEKYESLNRFRKNVLITDKGTLVEFTDKAALVR